MIKLMKGSAASLLFIYIIQHPSSARKLVTNLSPYCFSFAVLVSLHSIGLNLRGILRFRGVEFKGRNNFFITARPKTGRFLTILEFHTSPTCDGGRNKRPVRFIDRELATTLSRGDKAVSQKNRGQIITCYLLSLRGSSFKEKRRLFRNDFVLQHYSEGPACPACMLY